MTKIRVEYVEEQCKKIVDQLEAGISINTGQIWAKKRPKVVNVTNAKLKSKRNLQNVALSRV